MKTMSVSEFKKSCTQVLRELPHAGEAPLITSRSKPLAKIEPVVAKGRHPAGGLLAGHVVSIAGEFDEPAGDDEWDAAR